MQKYCFFPDLASSWINCTRSYPEYVRSDIRINETVPLVCLCVCVLRWWPTWSSSTIKRRTENREYERWNNKRPKTSFFNCNFIVCAMFDAIVKPPACNRLLLYGSRWACDLFSYVLCFFFCDIISTFQISWAIFVSFVLLLLLLAVVVSFILVLV